MRRDHATGHSARSAASVEDSARDRRYARRCAQDLGARPRPVPAKVSPRAYRRNRKASLVRARPEGVAGFAMKLTELVDGIRLDRCSEATTHPSAHEQHSATPRYAASIPMVDSAGHNGTRSPARSSNCLRGRRAGAPERHPLCLAQRSPILVSTQGFFRTERCG